MKKKSSLGFAQHINNQDEEEDTPDTGPSDTDNATLEYFFQTFTPATSFKDATHYYTTNQIYEEMWQHAGKLSFKVDYLYNWLKQKGYRFDNLDGVKVVWLLIEQE